MSLLMEALKKAEESKRQTGAKGAAQVSPPGGGETSRPYANETRQTLPELSHHIDAVNADLAALSSTPRRRPGDGKKTEDSPPPQNDQLAARNVFSAKPFPQSRSLRLVVLAAVIVLASLLVAHLWQRLPLRTPQPSGATRPASPRPPALPAAQRPDAGQNTPPLSSPAPLGEKSIVSAPHAGRIAPSPAVRPAQKALPATPPRENQAIRLSRTHSRPDPLLEHAYANLRTGHAKEAQEDYARVLHKDPMNSDALLGLAATALRRGESERAADYYQRALQAEPQNATAQAGLINMSVTDDAVALESRLNSALSRQPQAAALHFALGNLYARQQRWREAQQAYFQAYANAPDTADYLFNLAVSLDHLNQDKLAAQYYRQAVAAAENSRDNAFDIDQAKARLLGLPR